MGVLANHCSTAMRLNSTKILKSNRQHCACRHSVSQPIWRRAQKTCCLCILLLSGKQCSAVCAMQPLHEVLCLCTTVQMSWSCCFSGGQTRETGSMSVPDQPICRSRKVKNASSSCGLHRAVSYCISPVSVLKRYSTTCAWVVGCFRACIRNINVLSLHKGRNSKLQNMTAHALECSSAFDVHAEPCTVGTDPASMQNMTGSCVTLLTVLQVAPDAFVPFQP